MAHRSAEGAAGAAAVARAVAWAARIARLPAPLPSSAQTSVRFLPPAAREGADDDAAAGRSRLRLFEREAREGRCRRQASRLLTPPPPPSPPGPPRCGHAGAGPAGRAGRGRSSGRGDAQRRRRRRAVEAGGAGVQRKEDDAARHHADNRCCHEGPRFHHARAASIKALAEGCPAADAEGGALAVGMLLIAVNGEKVHGHDGGSALLKAASGTIEPRWWRRRRRFPTTSATGRRGCSRPPPPPRPRRSTPAAAAAARDDRRPREGGDDDAARDHAGERLEQGQAAADQGARRRLPRRRVRRALGMLLTAVNGEASAATSRGQCAQGCNGTLPRGAARAEAAALMRRRRRRRRHDDKTRLRKKSEVTSGTMRRMLRGPGIRHQQPGPARGPYARRRTLGLVFLFLML